MLKKGLGYLVLLASAGCVIYMVYEGKLPIPDRNGNGNHDPVNSAAIDPTNSGSAPLARTPTVSVTVRHVPKDRAVRHKRLRKRTEFFVTGMKIEGTLRSDQFALKGDDGKEHAIEGYVVYRQENGQWKRSDIDVKSPRQMVLFSQTASGITRSIYKEGSVKVNGNQGLTLYVSGSDLTGRLTYLDEPLNAKYKVEGAEEDSK